VVRDHCPPAEGAASFRTTRWTIVMQAAQSQAPGGQSALAQLCRSYWYPRYEEIHALCEALIASEGRLGP
jgi:hypothetical protein